MYAVVKTGGKQYKVSAGDMLKVEKLEGSVGDTIELNEVLMVGGENVAIGTPLVPSASVIGKIVEQGKDKKILVFKSKRRKNSRKLNGRMTVSIPRPRSDVWTSRESIRAEDPETTISAFSESRTRRTKRSQPGTSWISSRNQYTVSRLRSAGSRR